MEGQFTALVNTTELTDMGHWFIYLYTVRERSEIMFSFPKNWAVYVQFIHIEYVQATALTTM